MSKTLIIGAGKVGTATNISIGNIADFHDPFKNIYNNSYSNYKYVIVCVDTVQTGPSDYSDLESVLDELDAAEYAGSVVIRSTVSPVKVAEWDSKYKLNYLFFPEFMPQRDGNLVTDTSWIAVLGGNDNLTKEFAEEVLMHNSYPVDKDSYIYTSKIEACIIKLADNAGLSSKLIYFNAIYMICKKFNVPYDVVQKAIGLDLRIGIHHSTVPSPDDGMFGFGGHCLPKDILAISEIDDLEFFKQIAKINNSLRSI